MENGQLRDQIFAEACRGNQHAFAFLVALFDVADIADDVHDQDKPARVADVLHGMLAVVANPFFRANVDALLSLMETGLLSWDMSNDMPEGPDAVHYACQLEQVLFYVAKRCGGIPHAKAIASKWNHEGA